MISCSKEEKRLKDWISDAVIYQVNVRAFAAREPRNPVEAFRQAQGGQEIARTESPLVFLRENLDHIAELGANVVDVMPPFPMGVVGRKGVGSPYSIRDFVAIDPEYGDLDAFAALVHQAHGMDLRVILDLTPNHTSRDNVWVATEGIHCRNGDGSLYYDFDWSDTAKLDYTNAQTRQAMRDVLSFWLDICQGDGVAGTDLAMVQCVR